MSPIEDLVVHARAGTALDLRLARIIAWFKRQNLLPLGYTSYRTFAIHRVDWSDSWMREVVRLVESPLERVKAAVCIGLVPLRLAVRAPGKACVKTEANWLADTIVGRSNRPVRRRPAEPEPDCRVQLA